MMSVKPAEIIPESPTVVGVSFLEAATRRLCVFPISGAGAEMVVCGRKRAPKLHYCQACEDRARPPSAQPQRRIRIP
jgi:hypothetical protein